MGSLKVNQVVPVVFILFILAGGQTVAQTTQPAWADEFAAELDDVVTRYNTVVERDGVAFPGDQLLRNEVVNLHVEASDGSTATYSFVTDADLRVLSLGVGPHVAPTVRATASKASLERLVEADDPAAALGWALVSGEIRVKRVVSLFGVTLAVGAVEAAAGVAGVVVGAVAVAKVGIGGAVSAVKLAASKLASPFRWLLSVLRWLMGAWKKLLTDALTLFGALDLFGVVDVKRASRSLWATLTAPLRWVWRRLRGTPERDESHPVGETTAPVERDVSAPPGREAN